MSHDFESLDFDPSAALSAARVSLPCDDARPLGSLTEYENCVKKKNPQTSKTRENQGLSKKKKDALRASLVSKYFSPSQPKKKLKNVLTIMEEIEGPLAQLRQCMKDRTPIKVWTRGAKEMRGVCTGFLRAFDRHWNLVLSDVDETYVFPKKTKSVPEAEDAKEANRKEASSAGKASDGRRRNSSQNRVDLRRRHVAQMFVRGDNIAFVSIERS